MSLFGVAAVLGGLTWDAVVHAHRPELAAEEGIFTLGNPAHLLMGLGMAAVVGGLVAIALTALGPADNGRWSGPTARRALLVLCAVLVVATGVTTSWASIVARRDAVHGQAAAGASHGPAGSAGHDGPAGAGAGHGGGAAATHGDERKGHAGAGHASDGRPGAPASHRGHQAAPSRAAPARVAGGTGQVGTAPSPPATLRTVRYGPITLPPAVLGRPTSLTGALPNLLMPCSDCYMTSASIDLVYGDGRSANLDTGPMLHHIVLFQPGRPDATCGPETALGALGQRFFAAGNERTAGALPPGFGYHLGRQPVNVLLDLMNHSEAPRTVWVSATVGHVPGSTPGMRPVTPVWLDEDNCGDSEYSIPAGPSHRVARWTSNLTGRVLAAAGHVHDGGIKTVLTNESTGQHLCTSYAGYGSKPAYRGTLESMTTCIWDRLGTVRAGEVLALDTHYDSPEARDDAMGIMLAYVHETADLAGGTAAPASSPPPPASPGPPPRHPGHQ